MSRRLLSWHKENAVNMRRHAERERERVAGELAALKKLEASLAHAEETIARAESEGRIGYDADRFNVKKKP